MRPGVHSSCAQFILLILCTWLKFDSYIDCLTFNPYNPSIFLWYIGKQGRPRSDVTECDQGIHGLLTEFSIKY